MNEFQYNLVKTFLDGFKVPPKKLAKKWNIELPLVMMVANTPNYSYFKDMPEEDLLTFYGGMKK